METYTAPLTSGIPQDDSLNPLEAELNRPAVEEEASQQIAMAKWQQESRQKLDKALIDPATLDYDFSQASDPVKAREQALVRGYLMLENQGQPIEGGELGFQLHRSRIAQERFEGAGKDDDSEFFKVIQKDAFSKKFQNDMEKEMQRTAITASTISLTEGSKRATKFTDWLKEARTKAGYQPGQDFRYREIWEETQAQVKENLDSFRTPLNEIWGAMQKGDPTVEDISVAYHLTPKEDREDFMTALGVMANSLPKETKNEFFLNLSRSTARGVKDLTRNITEEFNNGPGLPDAGTLVMTGIGYAAKAILPDGEKKEPAPESESVTNFKSELQDRSDRRTFASDIRDIAREDFDPVKRLAKGKTMRAIEGGLYAAPGAVASSLLMAVPGIGAGLTLTTMKGAAYEDMRRRLINQGVDADTATNFADKSSGIVGAIQFLPERIGFNAITRKSQLLNKVFTKLSDKVANRLARFTITSGTIGLIETGTEVTQDLIPALWLDTAATFNEEIPGTDWEAEFKDFGYHTLETFVATLPLALFGGAGGVNQEARNQAFASADSLARLAYGVTPENDAAIEAAKAKGPSSLNQAVEAALENRAPGSESAIGAVQEIAEAHQAAKELAAKAESAGLFPTIVHDSNSGTFTLYDQRTNEEIGTANTAEDAVKLAATHTESIDMEHADRVAFVTSILQGQQASANFQTRGAGELAKRTIIGESRMGETLTAAQAASGDPGALARIAAQSRLKEQNEGGDGGFADVVFGQSITDPSTLARKMRTTVNRIHQGGTILTVFHEETHGFWTEAQAQGRLTQDEAVTFLKALDTLGRTSPTAGRKSRGGQYTPLLKEDFDSLSDYDKKVAVDEGISEWMEAEILRSRKGKGSRNLPPGLVNKNLAALARMVGDKNVGKFRSFIRAIRDYFGIALDRAFIIQQSLDNGKLEQKDYDTFIDKLHGLTEQTDFEQMVIEADQKIAAEIEAEFDEQAFIDQEFPEGNPFSIGRARVTPNPDTQSFPTTDGKTLTGPASFSIGAWHGTPHKVDKFTTEKIGTGEGAQAYGWGLYFAANRDVAEQYRKGLTANQATIDGTTPSTFWDNVKGLGTLSGAALRSKNGNVEDSITYLKGKLDRAKNRKKLGANSDLGEVEEAITQLKNFDQSRLTIQPGALYTVTLNVEEDQLLDWDKPLSDQSEFVKAAIQKLKGNHPEKTAYYASQERAYGGYLYGGIAAQWNTEIDKGESATKTFLAAGIRGIRYLDGNSRPSNIIDEELLKAAERNNWNIESTLNEMMKGVYNTPKVKAEMREAFKKQLEKGKPTSNYVIFDEADIEILEENGQPVQASSPSFSLGKAWPADFPKVTIHTTVGKMKSLPGYEAAKAGDSAAAFDVVDALVKIDRLQSLGKLHPDAVVVALHGEEASGMNKLPLALSESLAHHAGLEVDDSIVMVNKPQRTGSTAMHRLASRPEFAGTVQPGKKYILADDVATQGGTLSEARAYIEENGGIVVDTVTLAAAQGGTILALDPKTELALIDKFGEKSLDEFASKTGLYQGEWRALTNSEANALLKFNSLETAENRILAGRQEGIASRNEATPQQEGLGNSYSLGKKIVLEETDFKGYFSETHEGETLQTALQETEDLFNWTDQRQPDDRRRSVLQRQAAQTNQAQLTEEEQGKLLKELQKSVDAGETPGSIKAAAEIDKILKASEGKPVSMILQSMIKKEIPAWNPIGQTINSVEDIFALNAAFRNPWFESLRVMAVGADNKVIAASVQSVGSINATDASPSEIIAFILRAQETDPDAKLIFSHNHPSGNPSPSRADFRITENIKEIADKIGVTVIDHVITNGTKGYSFTSHDYFNVSKDLDVNWTAYERNEAATLDNPDAMQNLGASLRAANKSATFVAYLDNQLRLRAVNILPIADLQKTLKTITKDASSVGANGFALLYSPELAPKVIHQSMRDINEFAGKVSLRMLDAIYDQGGSTNSAKAVGLIANEDPAAYSIGQSKIADLLRDDATSRIRNPEVRAKALSRIARNLENLRLEAEKLELQIGNKRLRKSLQREAAVRQAMRFEELENQALARHSGILSDEDLTVLTAQPIHANLVEEYKDKAGRTRKRGILMSRTAAAKKHPDMFTRDSAGEYDGADGMPSILFGGNRAPDQAAQDLYDAGLISDPYPDTMWEALRREQNSVGKMKEALESAKADLRAARATSQSEAKDWLKSQIGDQELNFSPKEEILRASAMLDAILTALPADLRGQIGGYTPLARLGSDETRLAFLRDRLARADRLLERFLQKQLDKQFRKLLERARPEKDEAGKRPKGKIGADVHELFQDIRDAMLLNGAETEAMVSSLDILAADPEITAEQSAHLTIQSNLTSLVGNWRNASADRMEAALIEGERIFARGYMEQITKNLRKAEHYRTGRHNLKSATNKSGHRMERVNKAIEDSQKKSIPKNFMTSLLSFEQVNISAFGRDSKEANQLVDWERHASSAKHDATFAAQTQIEDLFTILAGGKYKGEKLRWNMSEPNKIKVKDGFGVEQTFSELEALTATMMWRQEDGRRHMEGHKDEDGKNVGDWYWTDDAMDDIENQLSPEARTVRLLLTERYAAEYDRLNAIYVDLYGVALPKHKLYSPISVQPQQAMGGQTVDPVTGFAVSGNAMSPGALKTRSTSAIAEPNFRDALQTYLAHTAQMEHWMAYAPFVTEAQALINNKEVGNAIESKGGKETLAVLRSWLDYHAQGGTRDAGAMLAANRILGRMTSRAATVALVGRVSVLAIQSTQMFAAAAQMPMGAFLKRFALLHMGKLNWKDAINSDFIRRRREQMPPVVAQAMQGLINDKPSKVKFASRKMGETITGADALFTAGTYAIIYDYQLSLAKKDGLTGKEAEAFAHEAAERATERVAQPTRAGTRSLYENLNTSPLVKLVWAFASEARQKLALSAFAFTKGHTAAERGRALFVTWVAGGVVAALVRAVMRDLRDDEDDEFFDERNWDPKRLALAALTGPLAGVPILGDLLEAGIYKMFKEYLPEGNLLTGAIRGAEAVKNVPGWFTGDREFQDAIKDAESIISGTGLFSGNAAGAAGFAHVIRDLIAMIDNAIGDD